MLLPYANLFDNYYSCLVERCSRDTSLDTWDIILCTTILPIIDTNLCSWQWAKSNKHQHDKAPFHSKRPCVVAENFRDEVRPYTRFKRGIVIRNDLIIERKNSRSSFSMMKQMVVINFLFWRIMRLGEWGRNRICVTIMKLLSRITRW